MAYQLKSVSIRTNNTDSGMKMIAEMWQDIASGKLPILFDSEHNFCQGISPISKYSNYESDENGDYDLSVIGVSSEWGKVLMLKVVNAINAAPLHKGVGNAYCGGIFKGYTEIALKHF